MILGGTFSGGSPGEKNIKTTILKRLYKWPKRQPSPHLKGMVISCHPEHGQTICLAKQRKTKKDESLKKNRISMSFYFCARIQSANEIISYWYLGCGLHGSDPLHWRLEIEGSHATNQQIGCHKRLFHCGSIQHHLKWFKHWSFDGMNDLSYLMQVFLCKKWWWLPKLNFQSFSVCYVLSFVNEQLLPHLHSQVGGYLDEFGSWEMDKS